MKFQLSSLGATSILLADRGFESAGGDSWGVVPVACAASVKTLLESFTAFRISSFFRCLTASWKFSHISTGRLTVDHGFG